MITEQTYIRRACLEDFFNNIDDKNKFNKNNLHDNIVKNQQEFGHKKRIKP
jgi:hypothetical protein